MMIEKSAMAGSMESSDLLVTLEPCNDGIELELESVVLEQFGDAIREVVLDELARLGVTEAKLLIRDRGALDCTIRARVETAVRRASGGK